LVKVSVNRFASKRIETIRNEVKTETQRLRMKTINRLEEIFKIAAKVGRGQIRHRRINGKMLPISLNQRRRWVTVVKQIVITMNSIASNFHEKEIHAQLNELESLINEAQTIDQSRTKGYAQSLTTRLIIGHIDKSKQLFSIVSG
jgi:hypothetical protein